MRNVTRTAKPACLTSKAARWKQEYLEAIESGDAKRTKTCRGRYNKTEVRQALDTMYGNCCCYCEGAVGPVGADQIEHRKPVDEFPEDTFEWDNLHLGCAACNRAKSNKWEATAFILDAVADTPIGNHLAYQCSETGVRRTYLSPRGRTTVEHADLNREKLRHARGLIALGVRGAIDEILKKLKDDASDVLVGNRIDELREKFTGEFGSMIQWAVQEWLDPYVNNN